MKVLSLILAGGKGTRLGDLTRTRAKPALSFFGTFRLIDFVLSNIHHSKLSDVWLVEQFRPHSLNDHLRNGRPWDLDRTHGGLMVLPPFQGKGGEKDGFAEGNAEALFLQRDLVREFAPDLLLVMSADHIYRANFQELIDYHLKAKADVSLLCWKAPKSMDVSRYSVLKTEGDKVIEFLYKPENTEERLLGMEIFCCDPKILFSCLDALDQELDELGDYGDHLFPRLTKDHNVRCFEHTGYWRDVGTVDAYWHAHMQLLEDPELLPLDSDEWPFLTDLRFRTPARLEGEGLATDSVLAPGSFVAGKVHRCVIGTGVRIDAGAELDGCVVLEGARIGPKARASKAIIDSGAHLDTALERSEEVQVYSPEPEETEDSSRVLS